MLNKTIYIITDVHTIYGRGHFSRMLILANALKKKEYRVCFATENHNESLSILARQSEFPYVNLSSDEEGITNGVHSIIVDKRETAPEFIKSLKKIAPVIIVDSNGEERKLADVVIQMLPSVYESSDVNVLPYKCTILNVSKEEKSVLDKVLVYVGEIRGLLEYMLNALSPLKEYSFDIVADESIIDEDLKPPKNVTIKPFSENIHTHIYKACITYFGLTAFECCYLRTPVALISPTDIHAELAKLNSDIFFDVGGVYGELDIKTARDNIKYFLHSSIVKSSLIKNSMKIDTDNGISNFINIIDKIANLNNPTCCVCEKPLKNLISRRKVSNLYRCEKCKTINQIYFDNLDENYDKSYFMSEYKNQYGRSYEEDATTLRLLAKSRLDELKKIKPNGRILELGSAMGFFVSEALNYGYDAAGIEISAYASSYAKTKLDVNVRCASVETFDYIEDEYDIICAWYVLEHLPTLITLLDKLYLSLKKGGILAFSMPNGYGITGQRKKEHYANIVPLDHYYEFSPKSIEKLLKKKGFKRVKTIAKGIHLSRYVDTLPKSLKFLSNNPLFGHWYKRHAERHQLGDTFEAYFVKR